MFRAFALTGVIMTLALIGLYPVPLAPVAPAYAQGNCPNCDLPPGCRGNGNQNGNGARNGNGNGNGNGANNGNGNGWGAGGRPRNCQRLEITIESDIDFGRLVVLGGGEARVLLDLNTGQKHVTGDVDDLGGMPITGRAIITGAPFEDIRVRLPSEVNMRDPSGGSARIRDFVTDLPGFPRLDADGRLEFGFSGTLVLSAQTRSSGNLRGRVPISVEYP